MTSKLLAEFLFKSAIFLGESSFKVKLSSLSAPFSCIGISFISLGVWIMDFFCNYFSLLDARSARAMSSCDLLSILERKRDLEV